MELEVKIGAAVLAAAFLVGLLRVELELRRLRRRREGLGVGQPTP